MIDIEKLKAYIEENYEEPEKKNLFSDLSKIFSGGQTHSFSGMKKTSGMSPLKHPDFGMVKKKIESSEKEDDFVRRLLFYINEKGKTHPQVYNAAGMTADCFSKIISGKTKSPTRVNIIALAFALELKLPEAQDLLSRAGYYFPVPTVKEDVIFKFCFEDENGPYTIDEVNEALVECGFKPIGGRE